MKKLIVLMFILTLLLVGCKSPKDFVETVYEPGKAPWEGKYYDNSDQNDIHVRLPGTDAEPYPDFTKSNDTSNMCWAVAVCNALEYGGHVVDNRECVLTLRERYGNKPGHAMNAYNWYMREMLAQNPQDFYVSQYKIINVPDAIANWIDDGIPVVLNLDRKGGGTGHVISIYGYTEYESCYVFYYVDGDDTRHTRILRVAQTDNGWSTGNFKYGLSFAFGIKSATQ